jgi:hypothetical protein
MARELPPQIVRTPYVETFDDGHGGWFGWRPAMQMPSESDESTIAPLIRDGVLITESPWWVDSNHAPPGAGYLHLLAFLQTNGEHVPDIGWPNRFIEGGFSRDLRNARLTVRLRGDVRLRGAELVLLAQGSAPGTTANLVLTGAPLKITSEWTEQTIVLSDDADQWTCLGGRHDLVDYYGCADPALVLADLDVDLILVLFPLDIVPVGVVDDIHLGRPHHRITAAAYRSGDRPLDGGYEVDWSFLPEGRIEIDTIRIEYPEPA